MNIFLHRDDLRIHDNHGLKKASEDEKTLPVYVEDPRISERTGRNKKAFREEGIKKLAERYSEKESGLVYKEGETSKELQKIIKEFNVLQVFLNRSYTPLRKRIEAEIEELDTETRIFKDRLLVEPQQFDGEFDTFSPFYSKWKEKNKLQPFSKPQDLASVESLLPDLDTEPSAKIPEAGEDAALERWREFRDKRLEEYKDKRDDVADPDTVSRLSMYYSNGMLGLRKVLNDVENLIEGSEDSDKIRNFAKYRNELAWRELFYHVLWHNPEAVNENYKDFENEIEWRNDTEEFEAWKKGKTGVPLVDAGMRELRETGYMHNRTRQNVASFQPSI
jgi:deoxyribodipyrimidine photo-lyase